MIARSKLHAGPADRSDDATLSSQTEKMVAIVDHCVAAKALADESGHRFLAYLLAMTIQEARASLRPNDDLAAQLMAGALRNT